MSEIISETKKYWENGKNCARSTSCGILDYFGLSGYTKVMDSAMIPFGGGVGERSICGSLLGALAGMCIVLKEKGMDEKVIYTKPKILKDEFKKKMGTLYCKAILDDFIDDKGVLDYENPERRKRCNSTVEAAVLGVKKIVEEF